jgi:putative ABC transport system ATP-binding protein
MIIEGRDINLIYDLNKGEETHALRDVNFSLSTGEFKGIAGPSGSGKSSLLYIISGLKKPTSGTVYYDDIDMESFPPAQKDLIRKTSFGFVFQKLFLIEYMTVLDNILAVLNKRDNLSLDWSNHLLDLLDIKHLSGRKPFQLSGGQRQRVAIARALVNRPSVVIADEPTASLDHKNAREVMNILESFKKESAILVVTHDRAILENADNVVEMWDGKIIG